MTREAASVLHELDYWQAALQDLLAINTLVAEAAESLPNVGVSVLSLMMGGDLMVEADGINESVRKSLRALAAMDEPIRRLVELIEGRELALRREFDDEAA